MRPNFVQAASSHVTQKYSRKICSKAAFQSPWHYQTRLFKVFQGLGSNPGSGVPYGAPLNTRLLSQRRNNARIFFLHKIFHLFFNEKVSSDFFFAAIVTGFVFSDLDQFFFSLQLFIRSRRRWLQSFASDLKQKK